MDLCYDDVQEAYRKAVGQFADEVLTPARDRYDLGRPLTRGEVQELAAELGRHEIATVAPTTADGRLDLIAFGIFVEEVSRVDLAFPCLANALFFQVWDLAALLRTPAQQQRYGHMFGRGEMVAMGMSEPEAASNPGDVRTRAVRVDGGWRLDGHKLWTSHATVASGIVAVARKEGTDLGDNGAVSLFMVEADAPGVEIRAIETLGMTGTSLCEVWFSDVELPAEAELTPGPGGLRAGLRLVEQARMKIIFMAVGIAQAALDLAVDFAKGHTQFGRPIAGFQLVQEMLAEMSTLTEASRLLGYRAASLVMRGDPARAAVSRAKAYATEAAVRVTSLGIQVHGAMGLTREAGAERLFRDARMLTVPDGTTEIHKLVVGRDLTGVSAFR